MHEAAFAFCVALGSGSTAIPKLRPQPVRGQSEKPVGVHTRGETAAAITLASVLAELETAQTEPADALRLGFETANSNLRFHSQETGTILRATCVAAIIASGRLHVGHVGDARLYLLRGGNLYCLTRDHSLMQEIADIKGPAAACEFAPSLKHIMSRAVGAEDAIAPAIRDPVVLATGDTIMLCTDGLSGVTDHKMIRRVLAGRTPREAAMRLVELAAENGGTDNTTVVVFRVDADVSSERQPVLSVDELTTMQVRTADGQHHPVVDVIMNPTTWTIAGLVLDLSAVKSGASCEIPIHDVGPLSALCGIITTPQCTEALLDMYPSEGLGG